MIMGAHVASITHHQFNKPCVPLSMQCRLEIKRFKNNTVQFLARRNLHLIEKTNKKEIE